MGMKTDADTMRKILAMCEEKPLLLTTLAADREPDMVEPGIALEKNRLTILVAFEGKNENNLRSWKGRNRRSGAAWKAVRSAVGPRLCLLEPFAIAYSQGQALKLTFTRLGGRKLDQMANLGSSLKGVEDAIAYLLGASDGSPQWHPAAAQETTGPTGVRVEVELFA